MLAQTASGLRHVTSLGQGQQLHEKLALSLVEGGIEGCLKYVLSVLSAIACPAGHAMSLAVISFDPSLAQNRQTRTLQTTML